MAYINPDKIGTLSAELMSDEEYNRYTRDLYLDIKNHLDDVQNFKRLIDTLHPQARDVLINLLYR